MAAPVVPSGSPSAVFETEGVPCQVAYQVGNVLYWDLHYLFDDIRDKGDSTQSSWRFFEELRQLCERHPGLNNRHLQIRGMRDTPGQLSVSCGSLAVILVYFATVLDSARAAAKAEHALSLFRSIVWRVLPVVHSQGGCLVNVAGRTLQLDGSGCVSSFVGYIESYHRALVTSTSLQWNSMHPSHLSAPFSESPSLMDVVSYVFLCRKVRKLQRKAPFRKRSAVLVEELQWPILGKHKTSQVTTSFK